LVHFLFSAFEFASYFSMVLNYLWINTPATIYGNSNNPILLTSVTDCACYTLLDTSFEFSNNTVSNSISLVVDWYDYNGVFLFSETLITSTLAAANLSFSTSVKGAEAQLKITNPVTSNFTASTQAILRG